MREKKHSDLLNTNDAMVWAEEFVRCKKKNGWHIDDIDKSLMVGWFANAMAAQELFDRENAKVDAHKAGTLRCKITKEREHSNAFAVAFLAAPAFPTLDPIKEGVRGDGLPWA